jgi:hypothetical protein
MVFHYLDGKVDAEIYLETDEQAAQTLQQQCNELITADPIFRSIQVLRRCALK